MGGFAAALPLRRRTLLQSVRPELALPHVVTQQPPAPRVQLVPGLESLRASAVHALAGVGRICARLKAISRRSRTSSGSPSPLVLVHGCLAGLVLLAPLVNHLSVNLSRARQLLNIALLRRLAGPRSLATQQTRGSPRVRNKGCIHEAASLHGREGNFFGQLLGTHQRAPDKMRLGHSRPKNAVPNLSVLPLFPFFLYRGRRLGRATWPRFFGDSFSDTVHARAPSHRLPPRRACCLRHRVFFKPAPSHSSNMPCIGGLRVYRTAPCSALRVRHAGS